MPPIPRLAYSDKPSVLGACWQWLCSSLERLGARTCPTALGAWADAALGAAVRQGRGLALIWGLAGAASWLGPASAWAAPGLPVSNVPPLQTAKTQGSSAPLRWQALGPDLWWLAARSQEASAANRGQVAHVLLARFDGRLWLVGAGPSPHFARQVQADVRRWLGRGVDELALTLAQPELVMGAKGYVQARVWTSAGLDRSLRERCGTCAARWKERLGAAARDLGQEGAGAVRFADRLFEGADGLEGRWGPWVWRAWQVSQRDGLQVHGLLWWHAESGVGFAPGLLWGTSPPDLRDADVRALRRAWPDWAAWAQRQALNYPGTARWLGQQGPVLSGEVWSAEAPVPRYWQGLDEASSALVESGQLMVETLPLAQVWPGVATPLDRRRHELNWQRVWRQAEERLFEVESPAEPR